MITCVFIYFSLYTWHYGYPSLGCAGSAAVSFQYMSGGSSCDLFGLSGCFLSSTSSFAGLLNLTLPVNASIACMGVPTATPSIAPSQPTVEPSMAPSLPTTSPSLTPSSAASLAAFFQVLYYADDTCSIPAHAVVYTLNTCLPVDTGSIPGARSYYLFSGSERNTLSIVAFSDSECSFGSYLAYVSLDPSSIGQCSSRRIMNLYNYFNFPTLPFGLVPYISVK